MESLSAYESDEDDAIKGDSFKLTTRETDGAQQELDVNYDIVTMDMSEESTTDTVPDHIDNNVKRYHPLSSPSSSSSDHEDHEDKKVRKYRASSSSRSHSTFSSSSHSDSSSLSDSESSRQRQKRRDCSKEKSHSSRRSRSSNRRKSVDHTNSTTNVKSPKNTENSSVKKSHSSEKREDWKHESHRSRRRKRSLSPRRRDRSTNRHRERSRSPYKHGRSYKSYDSSYSYRKRDSDHYRRKRRSQASISRNKLNVLGKLGIEIIPGGTAALQKSMQDEIKKVKNATGITLPSYYNPIAVNPRQYAEQMQKRKLLWGGGSKNSNTTTTEEAKGDEKSKSSTAGPANVWQGAKFSQDQDGRLTAKFQRLMGIKNTGTGEGQEVKRNETTKAEASQGNDLNKKQEEMFNSMQMQYEVARVSTHTHRGVGLGFGLHQYPR